jgi:hypothetical protein
VGTLLSHLRHNTVAYAALMVALLAAPTSAYAVATIRSADIVDGQVKAPDLARDSVRSAKVQDGTIAGADVADGTIGEVDIADGTITGIDVGPDALSGFDIIESTLGEVPSARQGGLGRYGYSGSCDPESLTYVACSTVEITLPRAGRVLVIGTVEASTEVDSDRAYGTCRIGTSSGAVSASVERFGFDDGGDVVSDVERMTVIAVTDAMPAGTHWVRVECNQGGIGAIEYPQARTVAVALSVG